MSAGYSLHAQSKYEVKPLSFNTSYADEVAAIPYTGGVIFCSNKNQNVILSRTDLNDEYIFQLYNVVYENKQWSHPHILQKELISDAHQGPAALSADGNTLYITVNNKQTNGIFIAQKRGNIWGDIQPFEYNSADYTTAHPSISKDGKYLFFASDMPGGFGGFDIYCCEWTGRKWGKPNNLGTTVNTAANELYPFSQSENVLFFASAGHHSMGGLDVFSVISRNGEWATRYHAEEPINSADDDFAYTSLDDGTSGYFSSNRNGKTIDIFSFKSLLPVFSDCSEQEENDYTYAFNFNTSEQDTTNNYTYRWSFGDGTVVKGETAVEHTFPTTGNYEVSLYVTDLITEEETLEAKYGVMVEDVEQAYITITGLDAATGGATVKLDASQSYLPHINIENYYWIFDDGNVLTGKTVDNVYLPPVGACRIKLGVTGTDTETGEKVKRCTYKNITVN
jgi:PKD repeat protein